MKVSRICGDTIAFSSACRIYYLDNADINIRSSGDLSQAIEKSIELRLNHA